MKIHFHNVGRCRDSWTIETPVASETAIIGAIRRRRALLSGDIDIYLETGDIVVGGLRVVGSFTIEDPAATLN